MLEQGYAASHKCAGLLLLCIWLFIEYPAISGIKLPGNIQDQASPVLSRIKLS